MALELDATLRSRLRAWAAAGYPHECCGLLLGRAADGGVRVEEVVQARNTNVERRHDRYEIDPEDFLRADARSRECGLDIVGIWHTHPDHPARPSETDRERAWAGWSYLILSVGAAGVQAMRSWRLDDGSGFVEEALRPEAAADVSGGHDMSRVTIRIPTPLRSHTQGADEVQVEARDVREALHALGEGREGLLERVLGPQGELRSFVNVFVGSRDVRALAGLATPLTDGDVLAIIPAVAGGGHGDT